MPWSDEIRKRWKRVDEVVEMWWDADRTTALPADVAADPGKTLLPVPHPYVPAGGASDDTFAEMYGWDTHFINLGLLAHGRLEQVRQHILNQLHLIDRHGMVLNGNRTHFLTRSQPPVLADSVARYLTAVPDDDALRALALELIGREYHGYWMAPHHSTPTGLSTNRDLGDPTLRAELAAEAETGLDFTAQYGGDVRRCVPLITNCALARTTEVLTELAGALGRTHEQAYWRDETTTRAHRIREFCWDDGAQFFLEYDFVRDVRLPMLTLSAYWTLMAGVATDEQAAALARALPLFRRSAGGLVTSSEPATSPHPEWEVLQWHDPVVWPPLQMVTVSGLQRYGYRAEAAAIAASFVRMQVDVFERTGELWEKYNGVTGEPSVPVERYDSVPMHGWSAAALAVLGRVAGGVGAPATESHGESGTTR